MARSRLALAALCALLASPVAAATVTRTCGYKGEGQLGPLTIVFDEDQRLVRVTTRDGREFRYQDRVIGPIAPVAEDDDVGPVEQFVTVRPGRVEVGFRWLDDGSTGHLAYFDPAAFRNPAKRCVWRSLWAFATG